MLKLSRFLPSTSRRAIDIKDAFWMSPFTSQHGIATSATDLDGRPSGRYFANYTVFKGKSALAVHPVPPYYRKLDTGASAVKKSGAVMLTFFPAIGLRKYDYQKKQVFALSPTEVGSLVSLGVDESCQFVHDPSMKSSLEGQVKKSLFVSPNESGYFLSLTVQNNVQKTTDRLSVPISKGEFAVLRTALNYALPYIMGWDQIFTPQQPRSSPAPKPPMVERPDPDSEWEK